MPNDEPFGWAVTLTSVVIVPPTDDEVTRVIDGLSPYGSAVSVGSDRISVTMSAHGANVVDALDRGLQIWGEALLDAGVIVGIAVAAEVRRVDEQDRLLDEAPS